MMLLYIWEVRIKCSESEEKTIPAELRRFKVATKEKWPGVEFQIACETSLIELSKELGIEAEKLWPDTIFCIGPAEFKE